MGIASRQMMARAANSLGKCGLGGFRCFCGFTGSAGTAGTSAGVDMSALRCSAGYDAPPADGCVWGPLGMALLLTLRPIQLLVY